MPNKEPGYSENEMQEKVALYFAHRKFRRQDSRTYSWHSITPKVYREVRITQIKRISDVVIYLSDRKIINIECKLRDYGFVLNQAKDHLRWADYSYICFPPETYLPAYILDEMISLGIGLLFWHPDYFVEVLQSGYNKKKDKSIREFVITELKKRNQITTVKNEMANQSTVW
jgi:uncharacterized protein (UPF0248 family)